jgi:hypothetical protein
MRYCPLLFLIAGCQAGQPERIQASPDPPGNIRSVTVGYSVGSGPADGPNRRLEVSDPKDVQAMVDAFRVKEGWYVAVGLAPTGVIRFHLADGSTVEYAFMRADQLTRGQVPESRPAHIVLRDNALYDLVNKLVSKKEGRPIDVLKNNDPERPTQQLK